MNCKTIAVIAAILVSATSVAENSLTSTYETLVDKSGNISLPENLRRDWAFLGTWSVAAEDVGTSSDASGHGAAGLHNVYTQRETIDHFRETGKFPDGAVIVKELLKATTASMTTGTVSRGMTVEGWFVMVKDTKGRFPDHSLWGDGWGWSLITSDSAGKTVTTDYKTECVGCHIPARKDDWIYVDGYPVLENGG